MVCSPCVMWPHLQAAVQGGVGAASSAEWLLCRQLNGVFGVEPEEVDKFRRSVDLCLNHGLTLKRIERVSASQRCFYGLLVFDLFPSPVQSWSWRAPQPSAVHWWHRLPWTECEPDPALASGPTPSLPPQMPRWLCWSAPAGAKLDKVMHLTHSDVSTMWCTTSPCPHSRTLQLCERGWKATKKKKKQKNMNES